MNSTGNDPTWVAYTGGNTSYGVAVTGDAVYIGGHFRWWNNPYRGDPLPDRVLSAALRRRGPRRRQRTSAVVEPRPDARCRRAGDVRDEPGPVGRQRHQESSTASCDGHGCLRAARRRNPAAPRSRPRRYPTPSSWQVAAPAAAPWSKRPLDDSGAPQRRARHHVTSSPEWSGARGAFYLNGEVFYGTSAGDAGRAHVQRLDRRHWERALPAWSCTTTRAKALVHGQTSPRVTGMFYDPQKSTGSTTRSAVTRDLFYRYFTPESRVVRVYQQFTAPMQTQSTSPLPQG